MKKKVSRHQHNLPASDEAEVKDNNELLRHEGAQHIEEIEQHVASAKVAVSSEDIKPEAADQVLSDFGMLKERNTSKPIESEW